MDLLIKGAAELGLQLTQEQIEELQTHHTELISWNQRINLTAIVEPEEVQLKHFLDSLTPALVLSEEVKSSGRMMDVGAGGGFPGIPLKVVFPGIQLTLMDSVAKKTAFLEHLVKVLGLDHVEVYTGRAEDLALNPQLREGFDVVVSRGVAPMRILMELTLPYCRLGGTVVVLKKGEVAPEVESALHSMEVLGGKLQGTKEIALENLSDGRELVMVEKVKPTPAKFPRRPGLPKKHPL